MPCAFQLPILCLATMATAGGRAGISTGTSTGTGGSSAGASAGGSAGASADAKSNGPVDASANFSACVRQAIRLGGCSASRSAFVGACAAALSVHVNVNTTANANASVQSETEPEDAAVHVIPQAWMNMLNKFSGGKEKGVVALAYDVAHAGDLHQQ